MLVFFGAKNNITGGKGDAKLCEWVDIVLVDYVLRPIIDSAHRARSCLVAPAQTWSASAFGFIVCASDYGLMRRAL